MKKYLFIPFVAVFLASCHESLEERAEREAKEFTKKNCPMKVSEYVTNDSMTYEKDSRTIHYYYSIKGKADTTALDKKQAKAELIKGIKDATGIRNYKEKRFQLCIHLLFNEEQRPNTIGCKNHSKRIQYQIESNLIYNFAVNPSSKYIWINGKKFDYLLLIKFINSPTKLIRTTCRLVATTYSV